MTEVIVALDVDTIHEEEELLERLHNTVSLYKIGMRLFAAHGKRSVDLVHRMGSRVFLDLKLMDIPHVVAETLRQVQRLGVFAVSLHLWGGSAMLRAAAAVHPRPKLWGVTVLTSLTSEDLRFIHPVLTVDPMVTRLARMAKACRMDAVLCAAGEVPALRQFLGPDACFVTPGIRPAGSSKDDQRRVVTPGEAARLGIRYLVIGRPITRAPDPLKAAVEILAEMRHATPKALAGP